jgi:multidrug efflux system membrane fusion protein
MLDKKIKLVIVILGIASLWVISGLLKPSAKPETALLKEKITPHAEESLAVLKKRYLKVNATIKAKNLNKIGSEVNGIIKKQLVFEGQKVQKDDLLFVIENQTILARINSCKSNLTAMEIRYNSTLKLFKDGLASKVQLEDATARLNDAKSDLISAESALQNTEIRAPFAGTIDNIIMKEGDLIITTDQKRNLIATIVNLDQDEIIAYISSKERSLLKGSKNQEVIIETNQGLSIKVKVIFISSAADEATGTYLVKAVAPNTSDLVDGEAATMKISLGEVMAHKVPLSALIINSDGDLAIKRLEGNKIFTNKIELVEEDETSVWITGSDLPEKSNIILVGHYYAEDR